MTSTNPADAATIVNTVIDKYLESAQEYADLATRTSIIKLEKYKTELEAEKTGSRRGSRTCLSKGNVNAVMLDRQKDADRENLVNGAGEAKPSRRVTIAEYENRRQSILDTEMKILNGETELESLRAEVAAEVAASKGKVQDQARTYESRLDEMVASRLTNDPALGNIVAEINKIRNALDKHTNIARSNNDPPHGVADEADGRAAEDATPRRSAAGGPRSGPR